MTQFKKQFKILIDESEELFEMSNIRKKYTRLPVNIWIDDVGAYRQNKHYEPRIKFQADRADKVHESAIPISISKQPKILIDNYKEYTDLNNYEIGQIKNFIIRNYDILIKHWNQEIDSDQFKKLMKKV